MNNVILMANEARLTFKQIVSQELTDQQVNDLWHDWFCSESSLVRRGRTLISRMKSIANSARIPGNSHVFFKNNCPLNGTTYDSFSIIDQNGNVLFWVAPKLGYSMAKGQAQVSWGSHSAPDQVTGTWADVKRYFLSDDQRWAAYLETLPKPKFTVGVKVAVLGGYGNEIKEDEVAAVNDYGGFTLVNNTYWLFNADGVQIVHRHGRRSPEPRVRHCEIWQDYHDAKVRAESQRKERDDLVERCHKLESKLYALRFGTSEEVIARKNKILAIEAILES